MLDEPLQPSSNYEKMLRALSLPPRATLKTLQPNKPGATSRCVDEGRLDEIRPPPWALGLPNVLLSLRLKA